MYSSTGAGNTRDQPRASGSLAVSMAAGVPFIDDMFILKDGKNIGNREYPSGLIVYPVIHFAPGGNSLMLIAVIQARLGSHRLPGKVLLPLCDTTVLGLMVYRLRKSTKLQGIVVAISDDTVDDPLFAEVQRLQLPCFRGSELDVLDRINNAAVKMGASSVVRLTADCPLIDPDVLDKVVEKFESEGLDYCSNLVPRTFQMGLTLR